MALLGKISAVVTANTADFTRKIGDMKSELNDLNRKVQGYRLNLETSALDKTLTKLQLFRRTLQEAIGKKIDVGPLQDLYKVFEDLGKPLTKVKGQIESLSSSTQAYLYPALERAQKGFQNLFREIQAGSTTFDASRARIESLTKQIERLKASAAVVSDFSRLTGSLSSESAGATFVQPRALEELKRFIALREKASQLPASSREDPFFQGLVQEAASAAERIEALVAKIERAKLKAALAEGVVSRSAARGETPPAAAVASLITATESQRRAQSQLDAETRAQAERNRRIADQNALGAIGALRRQPQSDAERAAANAAAAIKALQAARPAGEFDSLVEDIIRTSSAAEAASGDIIAFAAAIDALNSKAAAGSRLAASQTAINKIGTDARRSVDRFRTDAQRRTELMQEARSAGVNRDEITGARRRDYLSREIGGRASRLQETISSLDGAAAGDLQGRLDAATASLIRLVNTKGTPLQAEINKLRRDIAGLEGDASAAQGVQKLLNQFDSSTSMNLQPRAVKDYINDFQLLLNIAGNLNEEMGTRFGESLQRSRARVKGLYEEIASLPRTPEGNRQAERLLAQIRSESRALAAELASLDPSRYSEKQLNRLLSANRRLRGDIAGMRGAAMTGQLALQQLTFAVDDFFSSTGGLEYKLRAVSNNISQFGFILGGTYGLIAGVVATVGTQLLLQFGGIGKASKEAEGALEFMNSELERSRSVAEQTKKTFEELAKAIADVAKGSPRGDIERRVQDIRDEQRKSREAEVRSRSPEVAAAAGERAALEERLRSARGSDRIRIRAELEAARRREVAAGERTMTPRSMDGVRALLERARSAELSTLAERQNLIEDGLFVTPEVKRSGRLAALRSETISAPANTADAIRQVEARIAELQQTQSGTDFFERFLAGLPLSPEVASFGTGTLDEIRNFRETERVIEELDAELARLRNVLREGADDLIAQFADQVMSTKEQISGVLQDLSSLRIDSDIRGNLARQFEAPAAALGDAAKKIEERLRNDPAADTTDLQNEAKKAADALEELYRKADQLASDVALGALVPASSRLSSASSIAGAAGGPTLAGTQAAQFEEELKKAEARSRRASARGDDATVAAIDRSIEGIRDFSELIQASAIAVAAFQRAAEEAALNLSRTLASEAQSDAERMRRRANRLASDPTVAGSAAAERDAAAARARAEADSNRQLEADVARERLRFEREMAPGGSGRVATLARQVREGRDTQANLSLTPKEQLAGKERADRAQAQLDREFEARTKPFRDAADGRDAARQRELEDIRRRNEEAIAGANVSRGLLGDNRRLASNIGEGAVRASSELAKAMEEARKKVEEAASAGVLIPDALKRELERLADEIRQQRDDFVNQTVARTQDRGGGFAAQSARARRELDRAGVFASEVQGQLTDLEVRRQALEQERDIALGENRADDAAAIQRDIDAMNAHAEALNAAAIAVAAFQDAANRAALDLQKRVESESRGAADSARRRANEAEAVFGAGSPQAREARAEQRRREDAARAAEDERARADRAIGAERAAFEAEMAAGANPAAAARAEEIRRLEQFAANEANSAADRERARAEADRLRREQEREFEGRPGVEAERRKADEADRKRAEQDSAARGRELMKTERQRREESVRASAGDIANAVNQMRAEGVGANRIRGLTQTAANNLARDAAPMLAGFAEEVMNARLSGPSRAALTASDVQTTDGARELNRLLRGDNPARDVNLVELKKQVQLLEAIERAILQQANVVVDL